ncbi:hypothetical protein KXR53_08980 [Inquilinus limosus]|uniref:hypothetical protein n=1 Tax=Inquilinus limosus TaxID=171674 RepID=UPI003F180ACB
MTKFDELRSIGHNTADSLGSGICFLIGIYDVDVFDEVRNAPEGFITVDFLTGTTSGGRPSQSLARAVTLYRDALAGLCEKHGTNPSAFRKLTARYSVDWCGPSFAVTVVDQQGRSSVDRYVGRPGRRPKVLDPLGRLRPEKPQSRS